MEIKKKRKTKKDCVDKKKLFTKQKRKSLFQKLKEEGAD